MVSGSDKGFWLYLRLAFFSAAVLLFQVTLTRLFSIAQFYHFAFLIISMAMLGYAVSGVALAFPKRLSASSALGLFELSALGGGGSILAAYLILNHIPFDSFSITWDGRQVVVFVLNYLFLSLPFFFGGLGLSGLLSAYQQQAGRLYAMNFIGAGLGCLGGLFFPAWMGGEGTVLASSMLAAFCCLPITRITSSGWFRINLGKWITAVVILFLVVCSGEIFQRMRGNSFFPFLELRLSPYKSLSYALQYPDSQLIYQRWNAFSRVDVVRSGGIRSLPGLSFTYQQSPPPQDGLFVDGDDLSPILINPPSSELTDYLPAAVGFRLQPKANALILEGRGGLDIWTALSQGSKQVTAVEVNPLIVQASPLVYHQPNVRLVLEDQRSFLQHTKEQYDVIVLTLTSSYHPIRSGAYSLSEDYRYTVESFTELIRHLTPDGLVVVNRWLQKPPSECLRTFALAVTALEERDYAPQPRLVVLRSYTMVTLLIKRQPFSAGEMQIIRSFAQKNALDLVYSPDLKEDETNRYNIQESPIYAQTFHALLTTANRQKFYQEYVYDVRPPRDDHPFFGHYFKWNQIEQTLKEFGKSWQPFGGVGMLALFGLLVFTILLGSGLIGITWLIAQRHIVAPTPLLGKPLIYFLTIGLGYMLVEIPMIQRFQLYLAHPAYAVAGVLFALLISSGLGSAFSHRFPIQRALLLLALWLLSSPYWFALLTQTTLRLPLIFRMFMMVLSLAPGGYFMGMAFPAGLRIWLAEDKYNRGLPLIWAVNGAASVIASVGAMILALSYGFSLTLLIGAVCYVLAFILVWAKEGSVRYLSQ